MATAALAAPGVVLGIGYLRTFQDINLTIRPGEFVAILGPPGSGRSTLLRTIAGFGPRPRGEIRRRVDEALALVGLQHLADRMPNQLSGGQQQRIALARTVAIEPLSNLDASLRVQMRRMLLAPQRKLGLTTIFVTHDLEEANTTSDRMAVLDGGVIQQVGTPQELYDRPVNRFVTRFRGTANILEGTVELEGGQARFRTATGEVLGPPAAGEPAGPRSCCDLRASASTRAAEPSPCRARSCTGNSWVARSAIL